MAETFKLPVTKYAIEIELTEDMLGTQPKQKAVYSNYIAGKAREAIAKDAKKGYPLASGATAVMDPIADAPPNGQPENRVDTLLQQEEESIQELEDKGHTGFFEDERGKFLLDYQVRGFLSEAARRLKEDSEGEDGESVKQLQDKIKGYVFIFPRCIRLPENCRIEDFTGKPLLVVTDKGIVCERPLRAQTAQGPRIAVVRSDVILAGSKINFELHVMKQSRLTPRILQMILSYGMYQGLGQWRSGSWGRFQVNEFQKIDE